MVDIGTSAKTLQSDLIDLSDVPLARLGEVALLPSAVTGLLDGLTASPTPLCEGQMAALCGTAPWAPGGTPRES
jgi:hypothetical protein